MKSRDCSCSWERGKEVSVRRAGLSNRLFAAVVLGAVCALCCCGKEREPGRYYCEKAGFSIVFPGEWDVTEGDGVTAPIVEAVSPWEDDSDRFSEYVSVDIENLQERLSLEEYFAQVRKANSVDYALYEEHETGDTEIDNRKAKWTRFDVGSSEGVMAALGFVMIKGKRGYLISCVAERSRYASYTETFENIVSSFRLE
jgi:hypothetical protein